MSNWIIPVKTEKELIDLAIEQIESETNLHIIERKYDNESYYKTCEFKIKEIPGFVFALWHTNRPRNKKELFSEERIKWFDSLNISYNSELIFFCQYERDLDKFKPSRSGFVTGIYRQEYISEPNPIEEKIDYFFMFNTIEALMYIKKHPIKSVEFAGGQVRYIWENDKSNLRLLKNYIDGWLYHWKYSLKEYLKIKKAIRVSKKYMRKLTQFNYIIEDQGSYCYPRIEIIIRRKEKIDLDIYDKEWEIIDKFDSKYSKILNINWFQYDTYDHILDEKTLDKDKKIRDTFYWHCNNWITKAKDDWNDDRRIIDYSVEKVPDLNNILQRKEKEMEERYGKKN